VSCFRDVPDGPLGEGICMLNLRKSLQRTGYNSCSGPYISGIALAYYSVVGKSITTNPGYFSSGRFLIGKGLNVYCFHNWGHL
jgi:hypothetical protein